MAKRDKLAVLESYLSGIPDDLAKPLATAIEFDRLQGKDLPHAAILEALRPALIRAEEPPPRIPTPQRLFCEPFEDLIVSGAGYGGRERKLEGRIKRSSLTPVWRWLYDDIAADTLPELCERICEAVAAGDESELEQLIIQIHALGGRVLSNALHDLTPVTKPYRELATKLGGSRVVEDARDMALVLNAAPQIAQIKKFVPKPTLGFDDQHLLALKKLYRVFLEHMPAAVPALLYVLMGRVDRPWRILELTQVLADGDMDSLFADTPVGYPGRMMLDEMEIRIALLREAGDVDQRYDELLIILTQCTETIQGIDSLLTPGPRSTLGKKLQRFRVAIAHAMERHLERVPSALRAALPQQEKGDFGGHGLGRPSFIKMPDERLVDGAVGYLALLSRSAPAGRLAGFAALQREISQKAETYLVRYNENLLRELKAVEVEEQDRALAYLETASRLSRYILSDDEAEVLMRRGRAATAH